MGCQRVYTVTEEPEVKEVSQRIGPILRILGMERTGSKELEVEDMWINYIFEGNSNGVNNHLVIKSFGYSSYMFYG
ncbi:unnamed protein product [Lepeophtheirus salmonis]|uniref:(salmon louse) hypothetical protein n=1 Tax=Lepeophtheirus salmonis TaxID=72036 RepID=A0A817FDX7_LEPSM|nr:unnamed protein product [Lepeophtheirus salmonis]CAG9478137.1 unnamed protein product [Lepeophtheirus salmonis]